MPCILLTDHKLDLQAGCCGAAHPRRGAGFPADKGVPTGRRQAAITFALQHADRVVRLGSLNAVEEKPLFLFSAGSLGQLAAFRRLAELELGYPSCVSTDDISLLPRSLRRQPPQALPYATLPVMSPCCLLE